jgi:hypothetical protein
VNVSQSDYIASSAANAIVTPNGPNGATVAEDRVLVGTLAVP